MPKRPAAKPKRPARRTQEERRRGTQEAVLKAAMTVLIEDGYEKFTTTRVAKAAGVSRGAQENYFRTKNELIVAATRYTLTQAADEARALAARNRASSDPVERFLADSKSFFFSPTFLALMEIVAVSRHDPKLSKVNTPVVREFRRIINDIWIKALCEAGYERQSVETFVKMTHYLFRGMALTSLYQMGRSDHAKVLDDWRSIASRQLKRA
jgi:AcrR family transcriptional regulator